MCIQLEFIMHVSFPQYLDQSWLTSSNALAHMNGMKPVDLKLSSADRSEILLVHIASPGFAIHL